MVELKPMSRPVRSPIFMGAIAAFVTLCLLGVVGRVLIVEDNLIGGVFWAASIAVGVLEGLLVHRRNLAVARQLDTEHCVKCAYPLRDLVEPRCPECGQSFDPARRRSAGESEPHADVSRNDRYDPSDSTS